MVKTPHQPRSIDVQLDVPPEEWRELKLEIAMLLGAPEVTLLSMQLNPSVSSEVSLNLQVGIPRADRVQGMTIPLSKQKYPSLYAVLHPERMHPIRHRLHQMMGDIASFSKKIFQA